MFKPGDHVFVKAGMVGATVLSTDLSTSIQTSEGVYEESDLLPGDPAVRRTAEGVSPTWDHRSYAVRRWGEDEPGLPMGLRQKVQELLKKATFDTNGHWKKGSVWDKSFNPLETAWVFDQSLRLSDAKKLVAAGENGIDEWVEVNLHLSGVMKCSHCGETEFGLETNGKVVRIAGKPCPYPDGLPLTEWELNVPSGKLVVANNLCALFPVISDDPDINTVLGCRQRALTYAEAGLAHGFVGNTCPGVYLVGSGSGAAYKIATKPHNEVWDGSKYVAVRTPKFKGKFVASICTDLWWYSICDGDEFDRRVKHFGEKASDFGAKTVRVRPGVYRFRHDEGAVAQDGPQECVFTQFEWVREPDPVRDLLAEHQGISMNPHQYVAAQAERWPTLFGNGKKTPWSEYTEAERLSAWQEVADQIFCTIGGGTEWHEKGFPLAKANPTVPDMEPPSFRAQYSWYPFSAPYGGLFENIHFSPGFAKLAFRVLESVISFGMAVREDRPKGIREVGPARARMMVAVKRYRELAPLYPEAADPAYVGWLSQEGRAEKWVRDFDLGPKVIKDGPVRLGALRKALGL